jgi:hypothetical protein
MVERRKRKETREEEEIKARLKERRVSLEPTIYE